MYNLVSLNDVLCHLKLFLETQGIPLRNIEKADERLVIYYKSLRRVENMEYIQTTEEVARYITFFIEYSRILQVDQKIIKRNLKLSLSLKTKIEFFLILHSC